jgi:hypothetical protein
MCGSGAIRYGVETERATGPAADQAAQDEWQSLPCAKAVQGLQGVAGTGREKAAGGAAMGGSSPVHDEQHFERSGQHGMLGVMCRPSQVACFRGHRAALPGGRPGADGPRRTGPVVPSLASSCAARSKWPRRASNVNGAAPGVVLIRYVPPGRSGWDRAISRSRRLRRLRTTAVPIFLLMANASTGGWGVAAGNQETIIGPDRAMPALRSFSKPERSGAFHLKR